MKAHVTRILSDNVIQLDHRWLFHGIQGSAVKIAGLLPGDKSERPKNIDFLHNLLIDKEIEIVDLLFVSGKTLSAVIKYDGKYLQDYFNIDRQLPVVVPSRWINPDETAIITKVFGGIPLNWENPIAKLPIESAPFFGNIPYPTRPWEKDYGRLKALADTLYVNSYSNKIELDRWFNKLLNDPRRDSPVLIVGEVGIGKSWFISHKLINLPKDKFHVIILDLRNILKGAALLESLDLEINDFLNYYIKNLEWIYPDFQSIYGAQFDPHDSFQQHEMQTYALRLSTREKNQKRLRYYGFDNTPDLIIAFDNIDHYAPEEQESVLDLCRGLYGCSSGIKAIFTIRPTTMTLKNRIGLFFGDGLPKSIRLTSPNVYNILERRLTTSGSCKRWDIDSQIPNSKITWNILLDYYKESCKKWGLAQFVSQLCSTTSTAHIKDKSESYKDHFFNNLVKYDCRHYLRIFRRILRSNCLGDLANITSVYFGIQALILRGEGPMDESESYLFNLFDNEDPSMPGNALIRYRVLEFFQTINDTGEIFDVYFRALGCGAENARNVLKLFEDAGLIEITYAEKNGVKIPIKGRLTIPGIRHLEIATNLWYLICIKTGMNIDKDCVLVGEEARKLARDFVSSEKVLSYYSQHGWIPENKFIHYLAQEELTWSSKNGHIVKRHFGAAFPRTVLG